MYLCGFCSGRYDQISLKKALDTIDARIESRSYTESEYESLQYWRGVIGEVHANFQTKLLACGPSLLMSLALSMDSRTADSNLLLHAAQEPFGL